MKAVQARLTPASQGVASALTVLAKAVNARAVVEIDTALGTPILPLLVRVTFSGALTSIDSGVDNRLPVRSFLNATGYSLSRCRLTADVPSEAPPELRDGTYGIVFINDDGLEYIEYATATLCLLHPGGFLIIHDMP